jgi:two-component system, cell cycle sensor histidine kinase and response regulator CckA
MGKDQHFRGRNAGPASRTSGETVLLVEDDGAVRLVTRRALEHQGYVVIDAAGGLDAVRLAAEHRGHIDLIVSDVVMPDMSGPECVARITATRPHVPTLYVSGYADDILEAHGLIDRTRGFVRKPFTPSELASAIRRMLD